MEPWLYSYYLSSDRLSNRFDEKPNKPKSTFWERKKMLEDPHEGIIMFSKKNNKFLILRFYLSNGSDEFEIHVTMFI